MSDTPRHDADSAAETYGKHSTAHARLSVVSILQRFVSRGQAIRLAWREQVGPAERSDEFPTAVLPVIRADYPGDDEDTEPSTAVREGRKWFQSSPFSWWPGVLVG